MNELKTIVVPLDGSVVASRVLPVVHSFAGRAHAAVILVASTMGGGGASTVQLDEAASGLPTVGAT